MENRRVQSFEGKTDWIMGNLRRVISCPFFVLCFFFHLTCHGNFGFLMLLVAVGSCYVWRHCNTIWVRRHNTGRYVGKVETCSEGKASQVSVNWTARKIYEGAWTSSMFMALRGLHLKFGGGLIYTNDADASTNNAWVDFPTCKLTQEIQKCVSFLALAFNLRLNFTRVKRDDANANVVLHVGMQNYLMCLRLRWMGEYLSRIPLCSVSLV